MDYGLGQTNIDNQNGIRYGVIPVYDIIQQWSECSEGDYGPPICPKCGEQAESLWTPGGQLHPSAPKWEDGSLDEWEDRGFDYLCVKCKCLFSSTEAHWDDVECDYFLKSEEVEAFQSAGDSDVFVTKSKYYTHAQFCSPCAPGACHLSNPVDKNGPKAYCFPPDWFDWYAEMGKPAGVYGKVNTSCSYPVYLVETGECIYTPTEWEDSKKDQG